MAAAVALAAALPWLPRGGPGLTPDAQAIPPAPSGSAAPSPSIQPPSPAPSPVTTGPGAVNCAEIPTRMSGILPADQPGELVPFGAVQVTRCETALRGSGGSGAPSPSLAPAQTVTAGVGSFARLLNTLPAAPADQPCLRIGFPTQVSFVFVWDPAQARLPLAVAVDRNCSALVTPDKARSYATLDPMPVFDRLARAQPSPPRPPPVPPSPG